MDWYCALCWSCHNHVTRDGKTRLLPWLKPLHAVHRLNCRAEKRKGRGWIWDCPKALSRGKTMIKIDVLITTWISGIEKKWGNPSKGGRLPPPQGVASRIKSLEEEQRELVEYQQLESARPGWNTERMRSFSISTGQFLGDMGKKKVD